MFFIYSEIVAQLSVGHSYGVAIIMLTFPGACPLFITCLLWLNFVENSLLQFSSRH